MERGRKCTGAKEHICYKGRNMKTAASASCICNNIVSVSWHSKFSRSEADLTELVSGHDSG